MSSTFISQDIWAQLTKAVRASQQPCDVAVAYIGKGAGRLLPLPKDSRLVVDASERSVSSGQTCPDDLTKLLNRGVRVFSVPNLHAKVFVVGRAAYIGSANVSSRSASQLVEAVIRTTDLKAVRDARQFVSDHCLDELTPTALKRLASLYRPPLVPGGNSEKKEVKQTSRRPTLPRLLLAKLKLGDWPESDQALHDASLRVAKNRRQRPRSFKLDSFRYAGKCPFQRGDKVVQVIDEGAGKVFVSPPGDVLHVRTSRTEKGQVSFVYLELPARRRRSLKTLALALGDGALKCLRRGGVIRNAAFARALLNIWAE
jgi:hypothetical protein